MAAAGPGAGTGQVALKTQGAALAVSAVTNPGVSNKKKLYEVYLNYLPSNISSQNSTGVIVPLQKH